MKVESRRIYFKQKKFLQDPEAKSTAEELEDVSFQIPDWFIEFLDVE